MNCIWAVPMCRSACCIALLPGHGATFPGNRNRAARKRYDASGVPISSSTRDALNNRSAAATVKPVPAKME